MLQPDILPSFIGAVAFLFPLFYLWSVVSFDRQAEPAAGVVGTFVLGAFGAFLLNRLVAPIAAQAVFPDDPIVSALTRTVFIAAIPEEAVKFIVLIAFARRFVVRDHAMAGIVFGAAAGFGFAAFENVGYLLHNLDRWQSVAFVRSMVTVPVHGALGIIAGLFISRARLNVGKRGRSAAAFRWRSYAGALLLPIMLHVVFDFPFALSRAYNDPSDATESALKALGLAIGLAVFLAGTSVIFRAAASKNPAFQPRCLSPYLLQQPWRLFILASQVALLGLLVIGAEALGMLRGNNPGWQSGAMLSVGVGLLMVGVALHRRAAGERLRTP